MTDLDKAKKLFSEMKKERLEDLRKRFPAMDNYYNQKNFDTILLLYRNLNKKDQQKVAIKNITDATINLFNPAAIKKFSTKAVNENTRALQQVFYLFIKQLTEISENSSVMDLCIQSEKDGSWETPEKQCEILNALFDGRRQFKKKSPFTKELVDLGTVYAKNYFDFEYVLRLFNNFGNEITKEKIINEMNYIREQQKEKIPCVINVKKTNYSSSEAKKEIGEKMANARKLKNLDSGFTVENYSQSILEEDSKNQMHFSRKLQCKFFKESDVEWNGKPYYNSGRGKIVVLKDERIANKKALTNKYLYQERNIFTHCGSNNAIYGLFEKEYHGNDEKYWEELLLCSLYDCYVFLKKNHYQSTSDPLLNMLEEIFKKIIGKVSTEKAGYQKSNPWEMIFNSEGQCQLKKNQLEKTRIYNVLDEDEIVKLKNLLTFLYCGSHEDEDFIQQNKLTIVLYSIYMTLSLAEISD